MKLFERVLQEKAEMEERHESEEEEIVPKDLKLKDGVILEFPTHTSIILYTQYPSSPGDMSHSRHESVSTPITAAELKTLYLKAEEWEQEVGD